MTAWSAGPQIMGYATPLTVAGTGAEMPAAGIAAADANAVQTGARMPVAVPAPALMEQQAVALPRIAFGDQAELDFEAIAAEASVAAAEPAFLDEEDEPQVPAAPPMNFEIEPVDDGGYHFIEVDHEPELNAKVVQMPLPVQTAFEPPARAALRVPRGIQDRTVFDELVSQSAHFNGAVFLIGVMGFEHLVAEHGHPAVAQAIAEATSYFDGLLNTDGFGCWVEDSAFVMILPATSAEQARLVATHTAEGLWDYQLRSLGSLPLIFHWGSAEASNDSLGDAVERAREQMLESGRARKQVLTASGRFRRRVVNG
jgi:GGDEF domain-containing protein